jgi:hypothetical protein
LRVRLDQLEQGNAARGHAGEVEAVPWRATEAILQISRLGQGRSKGRTMSEFEIELLLTDRSYVIGNANDEASALNLMAEAIRQYPRNHIRVRRGAAIIAERVPPRKPK